MSTDINVNIQKGGSKLDAILALVTSVLTGQQQFKEQFMAAIDNVNANLQTNAANLAALSDVVQQALAKLGSKPAATEAQIQSVADAIAAENTSIASLTAALTTAVAST